MFEIFSLAKRVKNLESKIEELDKKMSIIERLIAFHLEKVHGVKSVVKKIEVKAE